MMIRWLGKRATPKTALPRPALHLQDKAAAHLNVILPTTLQLGHEQGSNMMHAVRYAQRPASGSGWACALDASEGASRAWLGCVRAEHGEDAAGGAAATASKQQGLSYSEVDIQVSDGVRGLAPIKQSIARRSHQVISVIKATTSLQQLQTVLLQHGSQLNQVSLSATIVHLVKLNTSSSPEHRRLLKHVLEDAWDLLENSGQLEQLQARQLSNIIWACSKLRYSANIQLYRQCLARFLQRMDEAAPQSISNVLYAISKQPLLQTLLPDPHWLQQLLDGFCAMLSEATPQAISNTLWAVAVLRRTVPQQQLTLLLDTLQRLLPHTNALDLSNTLWAVATMGAKVPPQQLQQFLAKFTAMLPSATAQVLSSTMWAVATMGQSLPEQQLQQWLTAFMHMLPKAKAHHASSMLWAVTAMGYSLPKQQQERLLRLLTSQMAQADRSTVFQALEAVSRLQASAAAGPTRAATELPQQQQVQVLSSAAAVAATAGLVLPATAAQLLTVSSGPAVMQPQQQQQPSLAVSFAAAPMQVQQVAGWAGASPNGSSPVLTAEPVCVLAAPEAATAGAAWSMPMTVVSLPAGQHLVPTSVGITALGSSNCLVHTIVPQVMPQQ